jgi:hypothetical protein
VSNHRLVLICLLAIGGLAGCAAKIQRGGEAATTGALRAAGAKVSRIDPQQLTTAAEAGARAAVQGALSQLDDAETRRRLEEIVMAAAAATLRGIAEQERAALVRISDDAATGVIRALAAGLEGPLQQGVADTTRTMSASAIAGARDELATVFPECTGHERRACIERRIGELSHAASLGVARGILEGLAPGLVAIAFLAGAGLTLLAVLVVRGSRSRRGTGEPRAAYAA